MTAPESRWSDALHRLEAGLGLRLITLFVALILIGGSLVILSPPWPITQRLREPNWALIWSGSGGERFFIDTTTIRATATGFTATGFDMRPAPPRAVRFAIPRELRQRFESSFDCGAHSITAVVSTSHEPALAAFTVSQYPGTPPLFGAAPRDAAWNFVCTTRARGAPETSTNPRAALHD